MALPSGVDGSVQSPRRRLELGASMEVRLVLEDPTGHLAIDRSTTHVKDNIKQHLEPR